MNKQDFSASFHSPEAPDMVYKKLLDVRSWWSGLFGEEIEEDRDGFTFRAGGGAHYSRQKLISTIPGKTIVWEVTESRLSFVSNGEEWTGSRISFELLPDENGTKVIFTHSGLTPALECYDQCSSAWNRYLQERLLPLISSKIAAPGRLV